MQLIKYFFIIDLIFYYSPQWAKTDSSLQSKPNKIQANLPINTLTRRPFQ
jgi:hypothetical protein